ncbi:MAG TPA: SDR family NAD(P)-dependent oxidoreductase, partial [Geminicoccus sp.]|uniref:SDR family NAD(P)-dependent oxidoreductase n=1 Tax=Geminicoccus sp. TaxID=2024832 RepID=UPI002E34ED53
MTVEPSLLLSPGYRVLVTAGASGIGKAITLALLKAGAKVHVCDVDEAALDDLTAEHLNASG